MRSHTLAKSVAANKLVQPGPAVMLCWSGWQCFSAA